MLFPSTLDGLMLGPIRSRARDVSVDAGATLVEIMVVVAMIGTLTAMAVWGIRGWATSSAHKGTAQQIQSVLRTTQQRAITEGTSFCVKFYTDTATDTYTVSRIDYPDPTHPTLVKVSGPFSTGSNSVQLTWTPTGSPLNSVCNGVTFVPRGSASPGNVSVVRGTRSYLVTVEGMTGRVSLG